MNDDDLAYLPEMLLNEVRTNRYDSRDGAKKFMEACTAGSTELVKDFLAKSSEYGFELRHIDFDGCMINAVLGMI